METLVELGADIHAATPTAKLTAIHFLCARGDAEAIHRCCVLGADANAVDAKGNTALHMATWSLRPAVLKTLLHWTSRSTLEHRNDKGETPLRTAAIHHTGRTRCSLAQYECMHALIAAGADASVLQ